MEFTNIKELFRNREMYIGEEVVVGGWLKSKRDSKSFGFLVINDGTCRLIERWGKGSADIAAL